MPHISITISISICRAIVSQENFSIARLQLISDSWSGLQTAPSFCCHCLIVCVCVCVCARVASQQFSLATLCGNLMLFAFCSTEGNCNIFGTRQQMLQNGSGRNREKWAWLVEWLRNDNEAQNLPFIT